MKNIFRSFFVVFCLFTTTNPLHAQWSQTNGPYGGGGVIECIAVSGTNLFAGTWGGGVFLSSDNGTNWTAENSGLTNTYVRALAVSGTNLFAGTWGGGVFLSANNGTSWTAENSGLTNTYVEALAVSGTNLFAGTYGGGVFLSTDNGISWAAVNSGLTNLSVPQLAVLDTNLFAGTYGGGVFLSTDNGTSWTAVNTGLTNNIVRALAVFGTNLFAGTYGGGVFLSTNNGTSWTAVNTGMTNQFVYAFAVSGTNLFAGTWGGGVFLSTNNGTNWTAENSGLTNTYVEALAVSGTNLFAGTSGDGVWRGTLDENLPVELVSFNVTSEGKTVAISWSTATEVNNYGFEIERRLVGEAQQKWAKIAFIQGAGSSSSPKQYSFTDQHVSAGRYAYRLKQIDNDGSFKYSMSVEVDNNLTPTVFSLAHNYPNPFNPSTMILFDLPKKSFVSLKVFDLMGREIATIVSEEMLAGSYSRQWNAASMPSGVYFYRLTAGSFIDTKKLMVIK